MKVSVIGHAAILIETRGISILSDPWWCGPCFGAQWWNYPPPKTDLLIGKKIDYIYISHGHHDHFHPGTLATLDKNTVVLVGESTRLKPSVEQLGFKVVELNNSDPFILGDSGVECRIISTHGDDTLMAVSDGTRVCINVNDALHSAASPIQSKFVAVLLSLYPKINYVFCGYGTASHFPNCYNIPTKDRNATAIQRQEYFNRQWAGLVESLRPDFAFPFAADVALLENDLFWVNEPVHNAIRPIATHRAMFPQSKVATVDVAPGFVIEGTKITQDIRRTPLNETTLRTTYHEQITRSNRYGTITQADVTEILELLQKNLEMCKEHLSSHPKNYNFLIKFRNSLSGISMRKSEQTISLNQVDCTSDEAEKYNIVLDVKLHYLKWSLTRPFGNEIMFVGSGCNFHYRDRDDVRFNLHRELITMMSVQKYVLKRRELPNPLPVRLIKNLVKRLIGADDLDLYDLNTWTKYKPTNKPELHK